MISLAPHWRQYLGRQLRLVRNKTGHDSASPYNCDLLAGFHRSDQPRKARFFLCCLYVSHEINPYQVRNDYMVILAFLTTLNDPSQIDAAEKMGCSLSSGTVYRALYFNRFVYQN